MSIKENIKIIDDENKELISQDLNELGIEIWNCRCLADILQECLIANDNLEKYHIVTISQILCDYMKNMSKTFEIFQKTYNLY